MHLTKQSSCAKIKINNKFAYVVQKRKKKKWIVFFTEKKLK